MVEIVSVIRDHLHPAAIGAVVASTVLYLIVSGKADFAGIGPGERDPREPRGDAAVLFVEDVETELVARVHFGLGDEASAGRRDIANLIGAHHAFAQPAPAKAEGRRAGLGWGRAVVVLGQETSSGPTNLP
mgnify:CR=1 FL=1